MPFDFSTVYDRAGKDALAVDVVKSKPEWAPKDGFDLIPMWVADMNFATAPSVTRALQERIEHPLYGYFDPSDEYFGAIIGWHKERNGVSGLEPKHIGYENGVLGGLVSALAAVCAHGDRVLVNAPTYIGFTHAIEDAGYQIVLSELVPDEHDVLRLDLADMEEKIRANDIRALVFCSPHNPAGRVWERAEIEALAEMAERTGVTIISDEIWSDLTLAGRKHTPTQSVSPWAREHTIALYAPSKTFNLAGLVGSYHVVYNDSLRRRMTAESERSHYNGMNTLSTRALIGAYSSEGAAWVDELREVLTENVRRACETLGGIEGVHVREPEGTYMLFLDCTGYCEARGIELDELLQRGFDVGVLWQDGRPFHGSCHIRLNVALPTARVQEALARLVEHVFI